MNILIATDGQLDAEATASMIARIADADDNVTVLTVIDHPGEVLRNVAAVTNSDIVDRILGGVVGEMGVGNRSGRHRPPRTAIPASAWHRSTYRSVLRRDGRPEPEGYPCGLDRAGNRGERNVELD